MQSSRQKNNYNAKSTPKGTGGDLGMSYMTSSSFNDSALMDVSAVNSKPVPRPPSSSMIHVSECKNAKCPLQHVWKNQSYSIQNPNNYNREDKEFG